ncbi:MAG TPA: hypothetical protein VK756_00635 [Solirubrobacteraceae bacterium]|jgi:hypothetical protein|nr:hypothetical protein [Solirubrobacteraceae bacterium]
MATVKNAPGILLFARRLVLLGVFSTAVMLASVAPAAAEQPFGVSVSLQTTGFPQEIEEPAPGDIRFVNPPEAYTRAGGHPFALTTTVRFPTEVVGHDNEGRAILGPTGDPKDIVTDLPAGLLGDPQAVPRCPLGLTLAVGKACPAATQIGVVVFHLGAKETIGPIVNLTPEAGQSAEFGLVTPYKVTYLLTAHVVRVGSTYQLTVVSNGIPLSELYSAELTFWGVPASPLHTRQRGLKCALVEKVQTCEGGFESSGAPEVPFLTMPADCTAGPETATVSADSWENPGVYRSASTTLPAMSECNLLSFSPGIEVQPDTLLADAPVGLNVTLKVPQNEEPRGAATPQLRDAVVTLPEGVSISPGVVDGIQACSESGPEGINFSGAESEERGLNGELQLAPGHCPDASIVGTAEALTPLLPEPVRGHLYLARPGCGGAGQAPCTEQDALDGNLYRLYLELGGSGALGDSGVNLKVEGKTEANPATGQLTTKFLGNPQLPFSELKIHLNGGPRAPLDNPAACGAARTSSDLAPWSAPGVTPEGAFVQGDPDAAPSSFFDVEGCPAAEGLNPGFSAGTVSPQAGAFTPFTLNFTRQDREQYISGIQVHTPSGLLGMLSSVPLCGEPQAAQGTCPQASKIGTTRVASGAGSHPFEIGGSVYLTTGYRGAPFGLSIVTDAVAGPFNLGLVVVRARIDVNPETAALTVTSDPLPQIVFGVPLRLKEVTVNIDRPAFMFNPTSCRSQQVTATVSGAQQALANVGSPFAAAGCKSLAFQPSFQASTSAHASRLRGASLDVKLSYPPGSPGSEANIAYVKVALPKQLPSRLTTLQKACPAAQFQSNPSGCPPASIVGVVRASTPLLPVGLSGPAYFVSHGGEAFPSLVVVLQGDGVRVDLTGSTFISKTGITSSTFKTVPDVPVSTFELYLPQGPYSALAANTNLCATALKMPTELVAQNGAAIHQSTTIAVTGCTKPTKRKTAKHRSRSARAHGHRKTGSHR